MTTPSPASTSPLRVADLRCEYAVNPLGIDARPPRLSWKLRDDRRGQVQTAWQAQAAGSPEALEAGQPDRWDSGRVASADQLGIAYAGQPLTSGERCYWRARAWDRDGLPSAWSEIAWFEMGLLDEADWSALWCGYPAGLGGQPLYFHAFFELDQPVTRARAYVSGLGLFEFHVNGVKAGDHVLDPAQTEYGRRVFYTTDDIGPLLRPGRNAVGAIVGAGWHGAPKLRAQLHIDLQDGSRLVVHTTNSDAGHGGWTVGGGPIVSSTIYDGEVYDARLERPDWCSPEAPGHAYDPRQFWMAALPVDPPAGRMQAQPVEPIRVVDTLDPAAVAEPRPGVHVFDLGQNMVGWARLRVAGPPGAAVTLRFAENLADDGTVDQGNLRSARCADTYILKGQGVEEWEPRFTYHGFRYVQVEGYPGRPRPDAVRGRIVHSDVAPAGSFECSHDLLNRLQRAVLWTESGNLHGLPTDCPQRDERMGWLNDMTVRAEEAHYNFGVGRIHAKWIADIHDAQDPRTGAIPDTAPYRMGSRPADPVTMCYLLVPWLLYAHHGDARCMAEHYDGFKAWVDYLTSRSRGHLVEYSYYGDWSPPVAEAVGDSLGAGAVSRSTPGALVSTAYYFYGATLLARMAGVLGRRQDAAAYAGLAAAVRDAFNRRFWDEAGQAYGSGNQACCSLALYMGLAPEERRATVLQTLARDVEAHDRHLTTGNLCSKYLLEALSDCGRHDLAYALAAQTTYPSWGFMLACGATTIWERWENSKDTAMHSKNHPMMATFSAWYYRHLAGIRLEPDAMGFDRFRVQPRLADGLSFVKASLETVRGRVVSEWRRDGARLSLCVAVPVNARARICVPKPAGADEVTITESGRVVWRDGRPAESAPGLSDSADEGAWVAFTAGAGEYQFDVE
jgi:alpha-L-rhamnosidase